MEFLTEYFKAKDAFYDIYKRSKDEYNCIYESHEVADGLSMDVIEYIPKKYDRLLCITTGLHGIEGYVGNLLLRQFERTILSSLELDSTHVVLIHAINPYGMMHYRKVNENNVDLNRNFLRDYTELPKNNGFKKNKWFFLAKPISENPRRANMRFYGDTVKMLLSSSVKNIRKAALLGQYEFPKGFFYGGKAPEKSAELMMDYIERFSESPYERRILLDLHTGYGPKYQMSIVNDPSEKRPQSLLRKIFDYPLVQNSNGDDFYETQGDMIKYINEQFEEDDYATCFEFGTIGSAFLDELKSLRIMIQENSVYDYERQYAGNFDYFHDAFRELYMPNEEKWLKKVSEDFDRAINGILKHYMYI